VDITAGGDFLGICDQKSSPSILFIGYWGLIDQSMKFSAHSRVVPMVGMGAAVPLYVYYVRIALYVLIAVYVPIAVLV
jgi:hypothetical protein